MPDTYPEQNYYTTPYIYQFRTSLRYCIKWTSGTCEKQKHFADGEIHLASYGWHHIVAKPRGLLLIVVAQFTSGRKTVKMVSGTFIIDSCAVFIISS